MEENTMTATPIGSIIRNGDLFELCPFCGKMLKRANLKILDKTILGPLEICDCVEAQKAAHKADAERQARKAEDERRELESRRKSSGMMFKQFRQTFETFTTDAKNKRAYDEAFNFALKFKPRRPDDRFIDDASTGLMFVGRAGVGKTHLAAAISNYLIDAGIYVKFKTVPDLLAELKHTYSYDDDGEFEIMRKMKNAALLILDDLGKEQQTEWSLSRLYEIINNRYENQMPIIVTSNYTPAELYERLAVGGDQNTAMAILSRLSEMCKTVGMVGQDRRKNAARH